MTSSDGFYPFPLWKISETSTQSSPSASVATGNEETGQSQTTAQQVEKRSDWSQGPPVTCSDEQPVTETQIVCPSHACLHLREAVFWQTDPPLGVPGSQSPSPEHNSQPVNSDYNPLELHDGLASEWVSGTHNADEMFSQGEPVMAGGLSPHLVILEYRQHTERSETLAGHGSVVEHGESVLLLREAGTGGEAAKPVPNEGTAVNSVEESSQDLLSTSEYAAHNVYLQLAEVVICHSPDPHTASALNVLESLSPSPEHHSGLVSSSGPNAPVELQDVHMSHMSPRAYSGDEMDPIVAVALSPPSGASTNLTESSGRLTSPSNVFEHEESVLLLSEANTDGEAAKPVPKEVTAVDSVEESCLDPLSSSGYAVVCHTQDANTASALGVSGALSPSPEHHFGPVSSDNELVELKGGLTSEGVHRTHTADMNLILDPLMAGRLSPQPFSESGDLRETSETLAGHGRDVEPEESVLLLSEAGTDAEAVLRPVPNEVTAVDSVEEYCKDYLSTSEDALHNMCQRELVGSLFPHPFEEKCKQQRALSDAASSNGARPDGEPLTKCVIQKDFLVAAEATDISAKEKQTGCSETLQDNPERSQASAVSDSPYSFRRKRRYPPSRSSSSVDSSSAPVSAKQSCPRPEQTCRPSSPPVEGCSQGTPAPIAVPTKRKRGRPRKTQLPASQNEVSSTSVVPAEIATLRSPVACKSTLTEDCLEESPDSSLFTGGYRKRKEAASASSSSTAGGETEGQGSSTSPPVPPLDLSSDALSQESESPAAPCLDLSLEQILQDDPMPLTPLSLPEEEEEEEDPEEDEELPSILERKPLSITEGVCVWCKFRKYPFWPAVVKSVNHKNKKASIVFIDTFLIDEKGIRKGLTVSLKTLKPLDCEEAEELTEQARQQYGDAISWCLELIYDYRIRIGCGSFSGSFIEYFANDISCPLRYKYSLGSSDLTFPTHLIVDDLCGSSEEDGAGEQVDEHQCKKMLPDRAKAARTRANEKLVDFIVRKRGAEKRLLAVISGQQPSKWLRALQKASRFVVDPYLEDEEQVDQVYRYLDEFLRRSPQILPCLANLERIPFILDVLLPEALIYAIAGVDDITLEQAEEKYRKGPCISKRERQEFNMRIEQLMKTLNRCKHVL